MFNHSTPIPTDEDLNFVHTGPAKLLHPGVPADKFYHLVMKEKLWRSWSGDSYGVKYYETSQQEGIKEKPIEGKPFEVDIKGVSLSLRDRMLVLDSKYNTPVAIIIGMYLKLETTYKIYTFSPNIEGQVPSDKQKHEGRDLYELAECKNNFFAVRKTLKTVDGVIYVMDGVGKIISLHRQMRITRNGKPCMYAREKNFGFYTGNQWEIKIGPGIDPILMIAFMAVIDEMNEDQ